MARYNLSFKRIISRLLLTFVVGILFGICMFPFLRVADGLLYEQRAAIGGENLWRAVALWGVYTFIFTLITFFLKRLRMVSIFLIVCLLISLIFVGYVNLSPKQQQRCLRSSPYDIPKEFSRALDLISQRLDVENNNFGYFDLAFDYRNCLNIQYSTVVSNENAEGIFLPDESNLQELKILIDPRYKQFDDLSIATVLIHELTHVGYMIDNTINNQKIDCFLEEAEAFTDQSKLMSQLNQEEIRSIYARLRENIDLNPAFAIVLVIEDLRGQAYESCQRLKTENNLTEMQFNDCVWTGVKNKLEKEVRNSVDYQKQCALSN